MEQYLEEICATYNLGFISCSPVSGGDINAAYALVTDKGRFFIKLNAASLFPQMFQKEAEGLKALAQANTLLKIPTVLAVGEYGSYQYLLMEFVEKANPSAGFWKKFAGGMAQLHSVTNAQFGWYSSNYIGSLVQQNTFTLNWSEFYTTQRILPLTNELFNKALFSSTDMQATEKFCKRLNEFFPKESPSLVHGDLWAGNFMAVKNNNLVSGNDAAIPCIYDPAVYFGHREMDIGMSLLFGGFDRNFYNAYNEHYPLEKDWRNRVSLTQLYPLLVHAVLFGGSYIEQCREILKKWI